MWSKEKKERFAKWLFLSSILTALFFMARRVGMQYSGEISHWLGGMIP